LASPRNRNRLHLRGVPPKSPGRGCEPRASRRPGGGARGWRPEPGGQGEGRSAGWRATAGSRSATSRGATTCLTPSRTTFNHIPPNSRNSLLYDQLHQSIELVLVLWRGCHCSHRTHPEILTRIRAVTPSSRLRRSILSNVSSSRKRYISSRNHSPDPHFTLNLLCIILETPPPTPARCTRAQQQKPSIRNSPEPPLHNSQNSLGRRQPAAPAHQQTILNLQPPNTSARASGA
jgi:hypothetical protein